MMVVLSTFIVNVVSALLVTWSVTVQCTRWLPSDPKPLNTIPVKINIPNRIPLKSDHSMRMNRYLLKPGEDTVLPNLIPIVNQKDSEFPMPHLYTGNLHAHEDGEKFIIEDQNEDVDYEYNFENEAVKTDKFIPYTYIIELSETYEDDRQPLDSETSQTTPPGTLQSLGSAYQHQPRLKSEDTLKKVEIFIEKGYDRGAYDHKGYQDHNSKWDKYKESEEGRYGGSSSYKTRENDKFQVKAHPDVDENDSNALERSGSSPSSSKLVTSRGKHLSRFSDEQRHSTKGRDGRTDDKVKSIPSSRQRFRTKKNPYSKKHSEQPVPLNNDHSRTVRVNAPSNKRTIFKSSDTNSDKNDFSFSQPGGGLSSLYNSPFYSTPFPSESKLSTSSSSSSSFEDTINQLFAFPRSSSMYDNFQSRHTIPAFGSADQQLSTPKFDAESTGTQFLLKDGFPNPSSPITKKRVLPDNSISPFHSIFPSSSHFQQSSKHPSASSGSQKVSSLSKHIGQPVSLLANQPCLATQALTANFEFGKFKPQLGSPNWFEKEPHILEPLKGQVDILREQVYAPALREALCL